MYLAKGIVHQNMAIASPYRRVGDAREHRAAPASIMIAGLKKVYPFMTDGVH